MARKFLYLVAALIVLVLAGLAALRFFADDLSRMAFVPDTPFEAQAPPPADAYADDALWIVRPGMGANSPAAWRPEGLEDEAEAPDAAVFFVHPTSYLEKAHWNAPLDDAQSRQRAELFVRAMACPFNASPEIWAPRYRQAAFGAFLTDTPEATRAVETAHADVLAAFDHFLSQVPAGKPVVLAGHSQGALMVMHLMKDRVAGTPLANRIAAAYVIGWPVSLKHDLPAMGLPACDEPDQAGCVASWASFAEPAEPQELKAGMPAFRGLDGGERLDAPPLCTNPLTGRTGGSAPAGANLGTLVPNADLSNGKLTPGLVPARCDERGLLLIGPPPEMGPFVLPGNNYHVYDVALFWRNLRADFARRATAWRKPG